MSEINVRRMLEGFITLLIAALFWSGTHLFSPALDDGHETLIASVAVATTIPMVAIMVWAWVASQR